ncbi:MAG: hypothetical protein ACR2GR_02340 [Rhodothermales bacterium]
MSRFPRFYSVAVVVVGLFFSACNTFEGFYEEGGSDDPAVLIQDAKFAMQAGAPEDAIAYLEKAIEQAPAESPIETRAQMQLATALLQSSEVGVLTLEEMARDLSDQFEAQGGAVAFKGASSAGFCSFPSVHTDTVRINLRDIEGYDEIHRSADVLARVQRLVNDVLDFDAAHPGPTYDIDAHIDSLRNQEGYTDEEIAETLLNGSVAYMGASYDILADQSADVEWYAVTPPGSADAYLGYCAPSEARVEEVKAEAACQMGNIGFSVDLLRARAKLNGFAGTLAEDVVELADEAYERLSQELDASACSL